MISSDESGGKAIYHDGIVFFVCQKSRIERNTSLMKKILNDLERYFSLLGCVKLSAHIYSSE
jgi:hypothetical protein